jgi:hypothetical protein
METDTIIRQAAPLDKGKERIIARFATIICSTAAIIALAWVLAHHSYVYDEFGGFYAVILVSVVSHPTI